MEINKIISDCDAVITYFAMQDEPDTDSIFLKDFPKQIFRISNDKHVDPIITAENCIKLFNNKKVVIFVPGQRFDIIGNRKGRGGGWYDRFLAKVPIEWIRIGISSESRISDVFLEKNYWDQSMNWLVSIGKTIKTIETNKSK